MFLELTEANQLQVKSLLRHASSRSSRVGLSFRMEQPPSQRTSVSREDLAQRAGEVSSLMRPVVAVAMDAEEPEGAPPPSSNPQAAAMVLA